MDLDLPGLDDKPRPKTTNLPKAQPSFLSDSDDDIESALQMVETKFKKDTRTGTAPEPKSLLKDRPSDEKPPESYVKKEIKRTSINSEEDRHNFVVVSSDVSYERPKDPIKDIEQRITQIKKESADEEEQLKKELTAYNKTAVEEKKSNLKQEYELKKQIFEEQLEDILKSRKYAEKLDTIADNLNFNSNLLNSVSEKLQEQRQHEQVEKTSKLTSLERTLLLREQKIEAQEKQLQDEREQLNLQTKQLDIQEEKLKESFKEEESHIAKEKQYLYEVFQKLNDIEQHNKEEIMKEEHNLLNMRESFNKQKQNLDSQLQTKRDAIASQEEVLEVKQSETSKAIEAEYKDLGLKKKKLDSDKRDTQSIENEYKRSLEAVIAKEKHANEVYSEVMQDKNALETEKAKFDQEAFKIQQLSLDLHNQSELIARFKAESSKEQENISRLLREIQELQNTLKTEQQTANDLEANINYEAKSYEKMRATLVQEMYGKMSHFNLEIPPDSYFDVGFVPQRTNNYRTNRDFSASKMIQSIRSLDKERSRINEFIQSEASDLIQSKIDLESGLAASLKPYSSKASVEEEKSEIDI